jgi:hypothetical protein
LNLWRRSVARRFGKTGESERIRAAVRHNEVPQSIQIETIYPLPTVAFS